MFAICLTARRYIHSTRTFYGKFKFSEVQTEKILSAVNNSTVEDLTDRFGLSKARANKLHFGRQQISNRVTSVEELLDLGGLSENVLHKFCQKILNDGDSTHSDGNIKKQRILTYINPKVPDNVVSQIKTFTSIQCGHTGLAWCTFELTPNEMTKIIHWDWRPLPESTSTIHLMASFISNTLKDVPQSDFYVFENPIAPVAGSSAKSNLNVNIRNMIGMASVLVAQRSRLLTDEAETDDENIKKINNVTYLRKYLCARLFQLYVGKEQTSSPNYVETMLRWTNTSTVTNDDVQTLVRLDDDLKSNYVSSESHEKEFLGCTLLTGLAFLRLVILKCPKSHAILAERGEKKSEKIL